MRDSNQLERLKQKREIGQKDNEEVLIKKPKNEDEERFADLSHTMYSEEKNRIKHKVNSAY